MCSLKLCSGTGNKLRNTNCLVSSTVSQIDKRTHKGFFERNLFLCVAWVSGISHHITVHLSLALWILWFGSSKQLPIRFSVLVKTSPRWHRSSSRSQSSPSSFLLAVRIWFIVRTSSLWLKPNWSVSLLVCASPVPVILPPSTGITLFKDVVAVRQSVYIVVHSWTRGRAARGFTRSGHIDTRAYSRIGAAWSHWYFRARWRRGTRHTQWRWWWTLGTHLSLWMPLIFSGGWWIVYVHDLLFSSLLRSYSASPRPHAVPTCIPPTLSEDVVPLHRPLVCHTSLYSWLIFRHWFCCLCVSSIVFPFILYWRTLARCEVHISLSL